MLDSKLQTIEDKMYNIHMEGYYPVFTSMTREERRTIKGRLLLAQAELKVARAQIALLKGEKNEGEV